MDYNEALKIAQQQIGQCRSINSQATEVVLLKQIGEDVFEATIKYDVADCRFIVASYERKIIIAAPKIK